MLYSSSRIQNFPFLSLTFICLSDLLYVLFSNLLLAFTYDYIHNISSNSVPNKTKGGCANKSFPQFTETTRQGIRDDDFFFSLIMVDGVMRVI